MRDLAGGHIQNDRERRRVERRDAERDRVGREPAVRAPRRRNCPGRPARVHEGGEEVAVVGNPFGPLADAAEVGRVPDPHGGHAALGPLGQQVDRSPADDLAECPVPVDPRRRRGPLADDRVGTRFQAVGSDPVDVQRDPERTVRAVSPKVSGHERLRDRARRGLRDSSGGQQVA